MYVSLKQREQIILNGRGIISIHQLYIYRKFILTNCLKRTKLVFILYRIGYSQTQGGGSESNILFNSPSSMPNNIARMLEWSVFLFLDGPET